MKIKVKVKLRAKVDGLQRVDDDHFEAFIKEPPIEGRANRRLICLLADYFGVSSSCVRIISGNTSRDKTVEIL